jgi:hypothetical protein
VNIDGRQIWVSRKVGFRQKGEEGKEGKEAAAEEEGDDDDDDDDDEEREVRGNYGIHICKVLTHGQFSIYMYMTRFFCTFASSSHNWGGHSSSISSCNSCNSKGMPLIDSLMEFYS